MPVIYKTYISRKFVREHPEAYFIFGDNDARCGYGGQAREMRGEPNSIGIRTKKRPSMSEGSFYTDAEFEENCIKIDEDFNKIFTLLEKGKTVYVPANGIGTGLSRLNDFAPKTEQYLKYKMSLLGT